LYLKIAALVELAGLFIHGFLVKKNRRAYYFFGGAKEIPGGDIRRLSGLNGGSCLVPEKGFSDRS
jgi:hypothetical protein